MQPFPHDLSDTLKQFHISSTPAEIALQRVPNVGVGWLRIVAQQGEQRHNNTRRTESALKGPTLYQFFLDRMQIIGFTQTLNRDNPPPSRPPNGH
jgi:hypothetical protein